MGNYKFDDDLHKKEELPAAWRGIGCVLMIVLPIMSFTAAIVLLELPIVRNFFYKASPALFGHPSLPPILWKVKSLTPFFNMVYSWTDLEARLILALIVLLALSTVIGVLYAAMYRSVNQRYGPKDVPPSRRKVKKYKR